MERVECPSCGHVLGVDMGGVALVRHQKREILVALRHIIRMRCDACGTDFYPETKQRDTLVENLAHVAGKLVPIFGDWCVVDMLQPGTRELERLIVAHSDPKMAEVARVLGSVRQAGPPARMAIDTGQPVCLPHISAAMIEEYLPQARPLLRALGAESLVALPLCTPRGMIGVVKLVSSDPRLRYVPEQLPLLTRLADALASHIERVLALDIGRGAVVSN